MEKGLLETLLNKLANLYYIKVYHDGEMWTIEIADHDDITLQNKNYGPNLVELCQELLEHGINYKYQTLNERINKNIRAS